MSAVELAEKPVRETPGVYLYRSYMVKRVRVNEGSERHQPWMVLGHPAWGRHDSMRAACAWIDKALGSRS